MKQYFRPFALSVVLTVITQLGWSQTLPSTSDPFDGIIDIILNGKLKGQVIEERAMETCLLRMEGSEWKVATKVIVMQGQ